MLRSKIRLGIVVLLVCVAPVLAAFTVGFADTCSSATPSVPAAYLDAFRAQQAEVRILPQTTDAAAIAQMISEIDLLVLCGGEDIDPARYGAVRASTCQTPNLVRDAFEWALLEAATAVHKPVFGICRGLQMINAYFGGTLYQDLETEVGAAHSSKHSITVKTSGFLWTVLQQMDIRVNSYHHQGVKDLAPGFSAVAWSSDGLPEAIENAALNVRGVQFHPEKVSASDPNAAALFHWLVTGETMPEPGLMGEGQLVAKWNFQNFDSTAPASANVLASALTNGAAAIPCYYQGAGTTPISDGTLGGMYVVGADSAECPGLCRGEYGLAIPKYYHLRLPTPEALKNHAWSMHIKFYRPVNDNTRACILSNNLANNSDGSLFIQGYSHAVLGSSSSIFPRTCAGRHITGFRWHELVINADASGNQIYLDGDLALASTQRSDTFLNNGGVLLAGDNDGEDNILYFAEVSLYDGFSRPERNVTTDTTLAEDADWRADGTVTLAPGTTVDLAGHTLEVSALRAGALQPVAQWNFNAFNSSQPKSTNVLASALVGGAAAIPCYYKGAGTAAITDGTIGSMSVSATGRFPGEYKLTIPQYYHLRLPTPDAVKNHAWSMVITFMKSVDDKKARAFVQSDLTNKSDASIFMHGTTSLIGASKGLFSPYGSVKLSTQSSLQELLIIGNASGNKIYLNGLLAHTSTSNSTGFFNNGAILLCADNDGEDQTLDIVDVRIYDTDQIAPQASCGAPESTGFATVTDSVGGGELHLNIPEGEGLFNHGVRFSGALKVVKTGAGLWTDCVAHSATGELDIQGGSVRLDQERLSLGAAGNTVRIGPVGALDIGGLGDLTNYRFELAGGVFANAITVENSVAQLADVRLSADSFITLGGSYGFINSNYTAAQLDLRGHTLSWFSKTGVHSYFINTTVTAGRLVYGANGGVIDYGKSGRNEISDFSAVTVENFGAGNYVYTPLTVRTWIARNVNGQADQGDAVVTITDRLKIGDFANGTSKIHASRLVEGAVLDLSELGQAWIPISIFSSRTVSTTFAAGARITVDLGTRSLLTLAEAEDPYVIKWGAATVPDVTTKFVLPDVCLGYALVRDSTGIRLIKTNLQIIIR